MVTFVLSEFNPCGMLKVLTHVTNDKSIIGQFLNCLTVTATFFYYCGSNEGTINVKFNYKHILMVFCVESGSNV